METLEEVATMKAIETMLDEKLKQHGINRPNVTQPKDEADRAKIIKTFNFFAAVNNKDHAGVAKIVDGYAPEWKRHVLAPQVEGTNSAGGYLVPQEFYADVLMYLGKYSYARKYANVIEMQSSILNVSTLTAKPSAAWFDENTAITASKATFGRLTLTAKKLAAIYPISNELLQDANVDVYRVMVEIFAEIFAKEESTQMFRGTGTPWTGILGTAGTQVYYLGNSSTSGNTSYADITWDDLVDCINKLDCTKRDGAKFFLDQNVVTELAKQKDSQGRYMVDINTIPMLDGSITTMYSIQGYEIVPVATGVLIAAYDTDAHVDTKFGIFGNLPKAGCWFGTHGGVRTQISHDATADTVNAFTNDLQLMRMTERVAFGVGLPAEIVLISTAAS
jgi:HK97 family phage major capsid protein